MANQPTHKRKLPPGHVILPAAATGSLGVLLAAGLHVLGPLERMNTALAGVVSLDPATAPPAAAPWLVWLVTAFCGYGLAFVLLEIPGTWRRIVIWISTLIVTLAWLPIAAIAGSHAAVAGPAVAAIWSGVCAIVYASSHRMAVDRSPAASTNPNPSDTDGQG